MDFRVRDQLRRPSEGLADEGTSGGVVSTDTARTRSWSGISNDSHLGLRTEHHHCSYTQIHVMNAG